MRRELELQGRQQALEIRHKAGWGDEPVDFDRIQDFVEKEYRVIVVKGSFEEEFSGAILRSNRRVVIVVNALMSLGHQLFTLAHELGHWCFEGDSLAGFVVDSGFSEPNSDSEIRANIFASHLLLPEDGVIRHLTTIAGSIDRVEEKHLIKLQNMFKVSWAALLTRLRAMEILTEQRYQDLRKVPIRRRAAELGMPLELYKSTPLGDGLTISAPHFVQEMGIAVQEGIVSAEYAEETLRTVLGPSGPNLLHEPIEPLSPDLSSDSV